MQKTLKWKNMSINCVETHLLTCSWIHDRVVWTEERNHVPRKRNFEFIEWKRMLESARDNVQALVPFAYMITYLKYINNS